MFSGADAPVIGADGTIFAGAGRCLYAVSSAGTLRWKFSSDGYGFSALAVSTDGTVYVGRRYADARATHYSGVL